MDEMLIEILAEDLMLEHGLDDWTFTFDRAKVRLGACHYDTKTISLSRPLAELASEHDITDTLLHEIAHALVGPRVGHGRAWRETAISIGCSGDRCHYLDTSEGSKYQYDCVCGVTHTWHRKPKAYHRRCRCGHVFLSKF